MCWSTATQRGARSTPIIANLNEIHQSLTLLATNPSQAALANAALQTQVASLRSNANRLPAPFAEMLLRAAGIFEGDLTQSSHQQLARALGDQVTGAMPADRPEPLSVHAHQHAGSPAHRFRPGVRPGRRVRPVLQPDLQQLVDTSRPDWQWRQDNALARTLSPATLREFQRAAQIRDAFFRRRQHPVDQSRRDAAAGKRERRLLDQARYQRHHRGEQGRIELAGFRAVAGHEPRARRHHGRSG